jgi:hypothetical protein
MNEYTFTNLREPLAEKDSATKQYVDNLYDRDNLESVIKSYPLSDFEKPNKDLDLNSH